MDLLSHVSETLRAHYKNSLRNTIVLAAVSGGVDSVVMLHVLSALQSSFGYHLEAVTVDHNLRTDGTSALDAAFTNQLCRNLNIPCMQKTIPEGALQQIESERNGGMEEAARFLRYQIFEQVYVDRGASAVFLAHNRNDQLETVLEHFLQGSGCEGLRGIPQSRDFFFRPLLSVSRSEIESYARKNSLEWRTDPTNASTAYYRNRIRHLLLPVLDEQFPGWDAAVLKGAGKARLESDAFSQFAALCTWNIDSSKRIQTDLSSFIAQPLAVRVRILYNGLNRLSVSGRIPAATVQTFAETLQKVTVCGVMFSVQNDCVVLQMTDTLESQHQLDGFCCFVDTVGTYNLPFGTIIVEREEKNGKVWYHARHTESGSVSGCFMLPAVIRSATSLDIVKMKDLKSKGVMKILAEWQVPRNMKNTIPVIEDILVRGIWGEPAGFNNWFVLEGVQGE